MAVISDVSGTSLTLIGLIIAAIGGIIAFAGQRITTREDSQKPNQQLEAIARDLAAAREDVSRLKSASPSAQTQEQRVAAEQKLSAVENRLSSWASDLVESSQSKKAKRQQDRLQVAAEALRISNAARPVFQFAVETIRDAIVAYNNKAKSQIAVEIPSLPTDLFSDEIQNCKGMIRFSETAMWKISFVSKRPASPDAQMYLHIAFTNNRDQQGSAGDALVIGSFGGEKWFIYGDGDHFAGPKRFGIATEEIRSIVEQRILKKLEEQLVD